MKQHISIEVLINIVKKGGSVKTGIDVFTESGVLLLGGEVLVNNVKTLEFIKENGVRKLPLSDEASNGVWDRTGAIIRFTNNALLDDNRHDTQEPVIYAATSESLEKRLLEIEAVKKKASVKYDEAKSTIRKVLADIRETDGEFDAREVEATVLDLMDFLTLRGNAFSYLTKEIFSYDDYLFNHSVNVCAIGIAVLNRFNASFSAMVNDHLRTVARVDIVKDGLHEDAPDSFRLFLKQDLTMIAIGFFLHDIGKVIVPEKLLNKKGRLNNAEFELVKRHSFDFGVSILEKNRLNNPFLDSIVKYHHAPLFEGEDRCYPLSRKPIEIPLYAKICKLADVYDAMTSKRSYKEAFNQINVVTELFRKYAGRYQTLQLILHAFVKSIGIYPPGSILFLRNGQMAYILESEGPIVLPFTDADGDPLLRKADPIDISEKGIDDALKVDNRRSIKTPIEIYDRLPSYLKVTSQGSRS